MAKTVAWENRDGIGMVTLNRPQKLNAMNAELISDLAEILMAAENDPDVKALVIRGAGTCFCAGADLEEHPVFKQDDWFLCAESIRAAQRIPLTLHRMPQPVIAALHGAVCGGGFDLALLCDIRIAATDARFAMKFVRFGLMPDMGGTYLLPRVVGLNRAMEMLLSGDFIDAAEAYRIGLVNRMVPPAELMDAALRTAAKYANGPRQAYRMLKWAVYTGLDVSFHTALENERFAQSRLLRSEDVKEAATALLQKRQPVFRGK